MGDVRQDVEPILASQTSNRPLQGSSCVGHIRVRARLVTRVTTGGCRCWTPVRHARMEHAGPTRLRPHARDSSCYVVDVAHDGVSILEQRDRDALLLHNAVMREVGSGSSDISGAPCGPDGGSRPCRCRPRSQGPPLLRRSVRASPLKTRARPLKTPALRPPFTPANVRIVPPYDRRVSDG